MKYDSDTAKVDRWHGMTADEVGQGYKTIDQEGGPVVDSRLDKDLKKNGEDRLPGTDPY